MPYSMKTNELTSDKKTWAILEYKLYVVNIFTGALDSYNTGT
jgi:hypothetical protein